jgi:hypothetical protein
LQAQTFCQEECTDEEAGGCNIENMLPWVFKSKNEEFKASALIIFYDTLLFLISL